MTRKARIMIAVPLALVVVLALFATVGLVAGCAAGDSGGADSAELRTMDEAVEQSAPEPVMGSDAGASEKDVAAGMPDDGTAYAAAVPPAAAPSAHYLLRTGDLSLLVKRGTLLPTVDRIKASTTALGGYVMSSNIGNQSGGPIEPMPLDMGVSSSEGGDLHSSSTVLSDPYATLVVRVPEQEFETAIKRFSKLGDVQSVSTSSEDVTSQFVDLQARLRHFRAVERRLVGFLQETTTVNQMLAVQDRIDEVQLTIEGLTAQLKSMREQTTYGTLSVYLSEKDTSAAVQPGNTFGGTFWNSMELLRDGARITALVLTALLPFIAVFGVIAVAAWYVVRRVRRSRRQAAQPSLPA
jgi:hypothetical protein